MSEAVRSNRVESDLRGFLSRLIRGENLTRSEASELLKLLLDGKSTDAQIAAVLAALAAKGETVDELAGMASELRDRPQRSSRQTAITSISRRRAARRSSSLRGALPGAVPRSLPPSHHPRRSAAARVQSEQVRNFWLKEYEDYPERFV